jgi:3-hydroxybutyryl-CoA dehydrogenase
MKVDDIKRVAVIGCGTMGNGIAQVFAQHEYEVILIDIKESFLENALATVSGSFDRMIKN